MAWLLRLTGLALAGLFLAGCTSPLPAPNTDHRSPMSTPAPKQIDERGLRTDPEPLLRRFPGLGQPASVRWMSGTTGTSGIGPSTYWIDAVVELTPDAIATLKPLATGDRALPSGLVDGIATAVPAGRTLGSDALDARLVQGATQAGWGVKAVLIEGTSTLVLAGLGE